MARIYVSSTYADLKECREAVYRALRSMGHDVVAMEDYVAADQRPLDKCLDDVASCDLYVGIFAWRYGYVPAADNPGQKSITELELRHAASRNIPRLIFLLDKSALWSMEQVEHGAGAEKLRLLREELERDYTVSFFKTCEQLGARASAAVANWSARQTTAADAFDEAAPSAPDKVSLSRLPVTGRDLFGREEELKRLDAAWADRDTHVLSLVAWGGVGKSALVNHWLSEMARDNYRGAQRVYGWSFYSQGTTDRAVSADQFIEAALVFFGDTDPNKGSPWDKGERLARLVAARRTLLVLDGLEPLQHPPGPDEGRLKDQALQSLLRQLAAHNEGLCLITTRLAVTDLSPFEGGTVTRIDLEHLSPEAGAEVLKSQGVKGTRAELEQASRDFDGHSLALTLLGSYLADVYEGDVSRRTEVSDLAGDVRFGGHAQKVMASYERWFGEGPELSVLRLLGLFNRPADKGSIDALRAAPAIPGLTDALQSLSEPNWQRTLSKLRRAKLLAAPSPTQPGTLDTHPLVREHFGHQLKRTRPDSWREGNNRLYEHLIDVAEKLPSTIEGLAPLYAAVVHGCEAGRHSEVLTTVYVERILRGNKFFSREALGGINADLAALAAFFDPPWQVPVASLSENFKSFVLSEAGSLLWTSGRTRESFQPLQASLDIDISQDNLGGAAVDAMQLSSNWLDTGDIPKALSYANQAIDLAKRAPDSHQEMRALATLAHAKHQAGSLAEAEALFLDAERMQAVILRIPLLYTGRGFNYCELLLDQGRYQEVQARCATTLKIIALQNWPFHTAMDHLSLGRAYLLQIQHEGSGVAEATAHLQEAVHGIRRSGRRGDLPKGLIAQAQLYRATRNFEGARLSLDEAMAVVEQCHLDLHKADCHLEYARLYLAQNEKENARQSWAAAQKMIERMGYHRRDGDAREIGEQLGEATGG